MARSTTNRYGTLTLQRTEADPLTNEVAVYMFQHRRDLTRDFLKQPMGRPFEFREPVRPGHELARLNCCGLTKRCAPDIQSGQHNLSMRASSFSARYQIRIEVDCLRHGASLIPRLAHFTCSSPASRKCSFTVFQTCRQPALYLGAGSQRADCLRRHARSRQAIFAA